jgi:hydrogenase maturation protease
VTRVLIGGVGYRWYGDASFGLIASDALARMPWPPGVDVADLGYGALLVTQDLAAATPPYDRLVVISAARRGRAPGLYELRWDGRMPEDAEVQERVREAGAGVVDVDHLLVVAGYFRALPDDVVVFEIDHAEPTAGVTLSDAAAALLPLAIERARLAALGTSSRIGSASVMA